MSKCNFQFKGGSKELVYNSQQAIVKFHLYVSDPKGKEEHLYQSMKTGVVEQTDCNRDLYSCLYPIVKVFSSTRGFGVPQEYFSYFFLLSNGGTKIVTIRPLSFERFPEVRNFQFQAIGRFLGSEEIRKLYGTNSPTWKYYQRQSFLSAERLKKLVTINDVSEVQVGEVLTPARVRMIRI